MYMYALARECFVHVIIVYARKPPFDAQAGVFSGAGGLNFGLSLLLYPFLQ